MSVRKARDARSRRGILPSALAIHVTKSSICLLVYVRLSSVAASEFISKCVLVFLSMCSLCLDDRRMRLCCLLLWPWFHGLNPGSNLGQAWSILAWPHSGFTLPARPDKCYHGRAPGP